MMVKVAVLVAVFVSGDVCSSGGCTSKVLRQQARSAAFWIHNMRPRTFLQTQSFHFGRLIRACVLNGVCVRACDTISDAEFASPCHPQKQSAAAKLHNKNTPIDPI